MEYRKLDNQIMKVLCEEWEEPRSGPLTSQVIHERLVAEGVDVPDGKIDDVLIDLEHSEYISLDPIEGRGVFHKRDSHLTITDVDPDLIDLMLG